MANARRHSMVPSIREDGTHSLSSGNLGLVVESRAHEISICRTVRWSGSLSSLLVRLALTKS